MDVGHLAVMRERRVLSPGMVLQRHTQDVTETVVGDWKHCITVANEDH